METDESHMGITINDFYTFIKKKLNKQKVSQFVYFHNLSFDGSFLLHFLNEIGVEYETVINDTKRIYEIKVRPSKAKRFISFRCSYLIFLCSVEHLPYSTKSVIDYASIRNYKTLEDATDEEKHYIIQDVLTVKRNLKELYEKKDVKLTGFFKTMGSISYKELKATTSKMLRKKSLVWNWFFPALTIEEDDYIRNAYRGGFSYLNPKYKGQTINEKVGSWDRVSSYPSAMVHEVMPAGKPYFSRKAPSKEKLYIVRLRIAQAKIKDGLHPFINPNRALKYLNDIYPMELKQVVISLTSIDYELYLKYYESRHEIIDYYVFPKRVKGVFNDYIFDKYNIKSNSKAVKKEMHKILETKKLTKDQDTALHNAIFDNFFSKLGLNSPYGKFGTNPTVRSSHPIFDSEGNLTWEDSEEVKELNKFYLPLACFITSYGRKALIEQIQPNAERFIYCDTDSIHLLGTEEPETLKGLIGNELNKWEYEGTSYKSKFIKAKQYLKLKEIDGKLTIKRTIASLSKSEHDRITFDNFETGITIPNGKRIAKNVKGGRIIISLDFTFK